MKKVAAERFGIHPLTVLHRVEAMIDIIAPVCDLCSSAESSSLVSAGVVTLQSSYERTASGIGTIGRFAFKEIV